MKRLIFFMLIALSLPFVLRAQDKKIKIAAIGNSVTFGAGIENQAVNAYPAQLQALLGDGYEVGNFGRSGATLLRKGHHPYAKTEEFQGALRFRPDITVIHLGLNDTDPRNWPDYRDEFKADYSWLIDTLKAQNPEMRILIARLSPIFSAHTRFLSGTFDWYWQIQEEIEQIAVANGVELIDFQEKLYHRPDLLPDALHPNKEGAALLATTVYQRISGDYGGLQLAEIFQDHMVLQRDRPIPVWGKADAGTQLSVQLNGVKQTATADADGKWKVEFPAMKAGGPHTLSVAFPAAGFTLQNILVGDVWLASGQSNMYWSLGQSENGDAESKQASQYPQIRLLKYKPAEGTHAAVWDTATLRQVNQLQYFSGSWKENSRASALEFSAVAYHFGKHIQVEEGVPVGLIEMAVGGSPLLSWIDRYTIEKDPLLVNSFRDWRNSDFIQLWCRGRANEQLANTDNKLQRHPFEPAYNFESGIARLRGVPIKGVLWYQGESDAHNAELHEKAFAAFVDSWRRHWSAELPIYFVQLSSINRPSWPTFRDSQRRLAAQIPGVYMAVSSDLGHPTDVHPQRKAEVGGRLAKLAQKYSYGKKIEAEGPAPRKAYRKNGGIVVEFDHGKGLAAEGAQRAKGFRVKTERGVLLEAEAQIRGSQVFLAVPAGQRVTEVLYGWEAYSDGNLINGAGLPASTFKIKLSE